MTAPPVAPDDLLLTVWRDHDDEVLQVPGMSLGVRTVGADVAGTVAALYREGVRRVALDRPVDLAGGMTPDSLVRAMVLLRELTSWGIVVGWDAVFGTQVDLWRRLNHLHPPRALPDHPQAAEVLDEWRTKFYLCKCVYRRGPGFVQVRDRRSGLLVRFTIDDPVWLAAMDSLLTGSPVAAVPAEVLDAYVAEGLAGRAGDLAWWLPYRVRRWPWPSMIV